MAFRGQRHRMIIRLQATTMMIRKICLKGVSDGVNRIQSDLCSDHGEAQD
jgi:hypothetical protein